jgi:hypothetical protein
LGRQSMGRLAAAPWIVWRRCGEALASWLRGVENEATPGHLWQWRAPPTPRWRRRAEPRLQIISSMRKKRVSRCASRDSGFRAVTSVGHGVTL